MAVAAAAGGPLVVRSLAVPDAAPEPSTAASPPGPVRSPAQPGAMIDLAGPLCLVLLAGLAMPPHQGWLVPLGLGLAMAVVGRRRLGRIAAARRALAEGAGGVGARAAWLVAALGSVTVLMTVLARSVGALVVDVPASLWGAGAAVLAALVWAWLGARLPERARPLVLLVLAAGIPLAGVLGTRYEAAGPEARGWAHSGPLLGIHPFQTTAILVDGEGPFDLPINDYVEPDGGRGYGPVELADAIDRALVSIAERVYPHGPARVRRALIDAEVEAVETPAVWERLDRPPVEDTQPRFIVRSGSFGRGSRVEFVCPGRRIDARGAQGETVMNRMCPDKYASEASAGLGVTGRWSGYSESRGRDRGGLHAALGWTRSADEEGARVIERETRGWAWLVLAAVALLLMRPLAHVGAGVREVGGAVGALAVGLLVILGLVGMLGPAELAVAALPPAGPSWSAWPSVAAWAPALALGSLGLFALDGPVVGAAQARAEGRRIAAPALVVVTATLALASALPALGWISPLHGAAGAQWLGFVRGVAESLGEIAGLTIFEVEGAVASGLVGLLLAGAMVTASVAAAAATRLWPGVRSASLASGRTTGLVLGVLFVAGLLVVSRKTAGAAALVPGVVGVTLVLGSGLLRLAPREPGAAVGPRAAGLLAHLGWTALAAALVWAAVDPLPSHPFVLLCTVVGFAVVLGAGLAGLAVAPRGPIGKAAAPDSDPPA